MSENNLQEIGINLIHERKLIMRSIRELLLNPQVNYGHIIVRMTDPTNKKSLKLQFKIPNSNVKVKHILEQSLQTFYQTKEVDISRFTLCKAQQVNFSQERGILSQNHQNLSQSNNFNQQYPHDCKVFDILRPHIHEEFFILESSQFIQISENKIQDETRSVCSPIKLQRAEMLEKSMERLVGSPAETIYVQRLDEEEMLQLNASNSDGAMVLQTHRNSGRGKSKSSTKQSSDSNAKVSRKTKLKTKVNHQFTNKEATNGNGQYLQNYITSNRQQHKKHLSSGSNILQALNFQAKKNSLNENAFSHQRQNEVLLAHTGTISTNANTDCLTSLSRGNSIKKMKTISNQQQLQQDTKISKGRQTAIGLTDNLNSQSLCAIQTEMNQKINNRRVTQKQIGKGSINIYQTINGTTSSAHNKKTLQTRNRESYKFHNNDQNELSRPHETHNSKLQESTVSRQTHYHNGSSYHAQQHGEKNKLHAQVQKLYQTNQSQEQGNNLLFSKSDPETKQQQLCTLKEIFSDFLDEQASMNATRSKVPSKVRAESLHSRQQILLEEDSLESTKRKKQSAQKETEGKEQNDYQANAQANRSKHTSHKSMYSLNTNQLKQPKKSICANNLLNEKQNNFFGTFDQYNKHQVAGTSNPLSYQYAQSGIISDEEDEIIQKQQFSMNTLQDLQNFSNLKPQIINPKCSQLMVSQFQENLSYRLLTEIDMSNKENVQIQKETFDGLGRRGGTLGVQSTGLYKSRADSNQTKYRNNRYTDHDDDLLNDMSEVDPNFTQDLS